jgi:hypothetical protein
MMTFKPPVSVELTLGPRYGHNSLLSDTYYPSCLEVCHHCIPRGRVVTVMSAVPRRGGGGGGGGGERVVIVGFIGTS